MKRSGVLSLLLVSMVISGLSSCTTMMEYEAQRKAARVDELRRERLELLARQKSDAEKLAMAENGGSVPGAKVDAFPGLRVPQLPTVIENKETMQAVLASYLGFAESASLVRDQVKAFGLGPWLASVQRVRLSALAWNDYFARMQFFPKTATLTVADLKGFYEAMAEPDKRVQALLVELNHILDRERSRPWQEPVRTL